MKSFGRMVVAVLLAGAAVTGWAGQTLSVRLVEASRATVASSPGLEDVGEILARNLPFASFALQGTQTLALPVANQTVGLGNFWVKCAGPAEELQVAVLTRHGKPLISTVLRLQEGVPVIVGGFPSANGKLIFVFVAW